jgi:hypothetical protein
MSLEAPHIVGQQYGVPIVDTRFPIVVAISTTKCDFFAANFVNFINYKLTPLEQIKELKKNCTLIN